MSSASPQKLARKAKSQIPCSSSHLIEFKDEMRLFIENAYLTHLSELSKHSITVRSIS